MIADDMLHGAPAPLRRCRSRQRQSARAIVVSPAGPVRWGDGFEIEPAPDGPFIERDTVILPWVVAESVWQEACTYLNTELPREWVRRLAIRAEVHYQRNAQFRACIRGRGNTGRDYLWAFNRHWLAALIRRHDETLFARLPSDYALGLGPVGSVRN